MVKAGGRCLGWAKSAIVPWTMNKNKSKKDLNKLQRMFCCL